MWFSLSLSVIIRNKSVLLVGFFLKSYKISKFIVIFMKLFEIKLGNLTHKPLEHDHFLVVNHHGVHLYDHQKLHNLILLQ